MTSPFLPNVPDEGTHESPALSPAMKIFAATTIIIGGAAVAAAFWKASLDFGVIDSDIHSVIDRSFTEAPLPNFPLSPDAISDQQATANNSGNINHDTAFSKPSTSTPSVVLPALSQTPAVDLGSGKYVQKYQPPMIIEPIQQSPEKIFATEKKVSEEKQAIQSNTQFEPIHKITVPTMPTVTPSVLVPSPVIPSVTVPSSTVSPSVTKNGNPEKIEKKPPAIPKTETNDEMLSLFQFADNFESVTLAKTEPALPENPFLTVSVTSETEYKNHLNDDLLPLHLSDSPQSQESLLPLKSAEIPFFQLQPLKTIPNQEPKT
ncbi:MAG: hypothetical protein LBP87_06195 [Planctomycetaceae bacterium]|jgi:hypothetical protein|nr:hypothetical protein [Planctomycetaceae bacterium]